MRIESKTVPPISSQQPRGSGTAAPAKPSGGDVVSISSAATGAAQSADHSNAAVANRIQEIRAQLAGGNYPIDLDRLASHIVDDETLRSSR
jgi:flagellar biosynthesis anti-sigma factor FlgM